MQIKYIYVAILNMISIEDELSFIKSKLSKTKNPHESYLFHELYSISC
jgi:hypothetical protein